MININKKDLSSNCFKTCQNEDLDIEMRLKFLAERLLVSKVIYYLTKVFSKYFS